jgi:uncharacterized protein CbrC (UPF0167 family)
VTDEPEFVPWQDHEWPEHCSEPARYHGDVGERELRDLAGSDDWLPFLREHLVSGAEHIDEEAVPPRASSADEDWDSLIHHFACVVCARPIFIWDMS